MLGAIDRMYKVAVRIDGSWSYVELASWGKLSATNTSRSHTDLAIDGRKETFMALLRSVRGDIQDGLLI